MEGDWILKKNTVYAQKPICWFEDFSCYPVYMFKADSMQFGNGSDYLLLFTLIKVVSTVCRCWKTS